MNDQAGAASPEAFIVAALLEQGRPVHFASLAFGLGIMILASAGANSWLGASVYMAATLVLPVEVYLAIRVGFDARLLRALGDGGMDLGTLDASLGCLGFLPPAKAARALPPRLTGALRLFRMQAICAILLGACLIAAMSLKLFGSGAA